MPDRSSDPPVSTPPPSVSSSTSELAARFRAYRAALCDTTATPDPQLRAWAGPVHAVMAELGERLARDQSPATIAALLGEPDEVVPAGRRHSGLVVSPGCEHLLYRWRGGHDYLYFVACGGRVQSSRWWHAGE